MAGTKVEKPNTVQPKFRTPYHVQFFCKVRKINENGGRHKSKIYPILL